MYCRHSSPFQRCPANFVNIALSSTQFAIKQLIGLYSNLSLIFTEIKSLFPCDTYTNSSLRYLWDYLLHTIATPCRICLFLTASFVNLSMKIHGFTLSLCPNTLFTSFSTSLKYRGSPYSPPSSSTIHMLSPMLARVSSLSIGCLRIDPFDMCLKIPHCRRKLQILLCPIRSFAISSVPHSPSVSDS